MRTKAIPLVLFLPLAAPLAVAQEESQPAPTPPAQEVPAAPEEPVAIPAIDVPSRADELVADLRRVEVVLQPRNEVETIRETLDERKGALVALHAELDGIDADRVSTRVLEDHRLKWVQLQGQAESWMSALQDRWKALQQEREALEKARRQWELTRAVATEQEFPPELLQRIEGILERLSDIEGRIRERSDGLAGLIDRVSTGGETVADSLLEVDAMAADIRGRWLARDEPPLWDIAPLEAGAAIWQDVEETRRYWFATNVEFFEERRESYYVLIGLFFVYLSGALLLRYWSRSWPQDDTSLDAARFVVSRPLSVALAFTLVSMDWVLGEPPGPARDLGAFLAILPVLRLGTGLLPRSARSLLYGSIVLFVLNRSWALVPDASLLRRLLLVVVTTAALVGAIWLVRRWRRAADIKLTGWWRVATLGLYLASIILAVSLLVGILGWSTLAQLLTSSTVDNVFAGLAWFIVASALIALVKLVPGSTIGRWFPSIPKHKQQFLQLITILIAAFVLVRWGREALASFQIYEPVRQAFIAGLSAPLAGGTLDTDVGDVAAALLALVVTILIARFVRFVLREEVLPRLKLSEGVAHSIVTLVNYAIIGFGILLAGATVGLSGTQLTVVFGALGVGIGFGLQTIVANFVSGLVLIFERPVKVGDRVQTVNHFGTITDIGIRASTIRTFAGAEVMVPNGDLVSKEVINWTGSDQLRRVELDLRVAYGTDPKKVLETLVETAKEHALVLSTPEPTAWMMGFGDSAFEFRLFAWTRVENFLVVTSELHVAVNEAMNKAGIEIPYPKQEFYVKSTEEGPVPPFEQVVKPTDKK
jgi:small-conductance mechanosensitive channel